MNSEISSYTLYLSLGSNMGDRFVNLQNAINSLFREVGSIVKISNVYETPAFGFEGEQFLNCAVLMTTELAPQEVMTIILQIEKSMGRERREALGYQSRPIDIDIIFIDDIILDLPELSIPHPRMSERRFVLQPLNDIDPTFIHPVYKQSLSKLLEVSPDQSFIAKTSKWLNNPMREYQFSKYAYLAIEGNIGAGKTSLATKMATDFNAKLILERFKDNPFLPKFYEDAARYAFPLEMSFLADRYQQLVDDITQFDLFKENVIADYDVNKSLIFASITLPEEEYSLYRKLFQVMHRDLPKPDRYIYLYQNTERLLENIKKRQRSYEMNIAPEYLQKLNRGYFEFIKSQHQPDNIKIIDISDIDFVKNRADYLYVLDQILD